MTQFSFQTGVSCAAILAACVAFFAGCSKEEQAVAPTAPRAGDAAYVQGLKNLKTEQNRVAGDRAAILRKIKALGNNPEAHADYADLTNRLAQCDAARKSVDEKAARYVRERLVKEAKASRAAQQSAADK